MGSKHIQFPVFILGPTDDGGPLIVNVIDVEDKQRVLLLFRDLDEAALIAQRLGLAEVMQIGGVADAQSLLNILTAMAGMFTHVWHGADPAGKGLAFVDRWPADDLLVTLKKLADADGAASSN